MFVCLCLCARSHQRSRIVAQAPRTNERIYLTADVPLGLVHDGRALMLGDVGVRVHADHQEVSLELGLAQGVGVAVVHHVEAAVAPDAHRLALLLARVLVVQLGRVGRSFAGGGFFGAHAG